ncbi:T9SS type A sorting domain-containing protein [Algibacter sp. 2305UL17-15]|uniref:T9SS type A sorting domain-containing protein n=1 Tax=Algibacter sp. 2305UL17-15 TaxID=3231268 RepID=UPI003458AEE0
MKKIFTLLFCCSIFVCSSQEWSAIPVPADPGIGKEWDLQDNVSDDFSYVAPAANKGATFESKWIEFYHENWQGPGLTDWEEDHSFVDGDELKLIASRKLPNKVYAGVISSNETVVYPAYIEISAKIMNSVLANGGWMLSPDNTQEIDFMEAYGAVTSGSAGGSPGNHNFYAKRMHQSHHVFIRPPNFQDWQPSEYNSFGSNPVDSNQPTWILRDDGAGYINWKDDYHRYGVYWKDPTHLYYYIDGVMVTYREGMEEIDPLYYTNSGTQGDTSNDTRTGLSKPMDIIFSVEDQDWRSNPGSGQQSDTFTPTDAELANTANHTFSVDWIRVYKPVDVASVDDWFTSNLKVSPNPFQDAIQIKADVVLNKVEVYSIDGTRIVAKEGINQLAHTISTKQLAAGLYIIKIESAEGLQAYKKVVKE